MPAYAYPIKIERKKKRILFHEEVELEDTTLTLELLAFCGADPFSIHPRPYYEGCIVSVLRSRLETDEERDVRVAGEERYMAEYTRRHTK